MYYLFCRGHLHPNISVIVFNISDLTLLYVRAHLSTSLTSNEEETVKYEWYHKIALSSKTEANMFSDK